MVGEGDREVYPPSGDTYLLREAALDEVRPDDTVLEVGTGSGVVAEALTDEAERVVASDVNPAAVEEARSRGVEAVRADLLDGFAGEFDLVVFNPPYLPDEDETPDDSIATALEGGRRGTELAGRFLGDVRRVLSQEGTVLLLASTASGVEAFEERDEFETARVASDRYFFEELVVLRLIP